MTTYNLTLDKNMTTAYYADTIVRMAVGDQNGAIINVTLGDGYQSTDISKTNIELRATAPDGQSVIQSSAATLIDEGKTGRFQIKLPKNITKKSGDIMDARFILTKGDVIESTSLFKIRVLRTPGMVEVNGDIIDRLDEIIEQAMTTLNLLEEAKKNADKELAAKLTAMQTTLDSTVRAEQEKITSALKEWTTEKTKLLAGYTTEKDNLFAKYTEDKNKLLTAYQTELDAKKKLIDGSLDDLNKRKEADLQDLADKKTKAFEDLEAKKTAALDKLAQDFTTQVATWQTTFDGKIAEWQALVDKLDLTGLKTTIDELQKRLDAIKADVANFDLPAIKKSIDDLKTNKADKTELAAFRKVADSYTKEEVDTAIEKGGKVKTATVNGGEKVQPDEAGNLALDVPDPDLTEYATTASVDEKIGAIPKVDLTPYAKTVEAEAMADKARRGANDYTDSVFGGGSLKAVEITESEYAAINTKDETMVYMIDSGWGV